MIPVLPLGTSGEVPETFEIDHNYLGFGALLRHLRRLPGCRIGWRFSWTMTDDVWATFHYKGFAFQIDSPFVDYWVHRPADCPDHVVQEVVAHLATYRPSALARRMVERRRRSDARWQERFGRAVEEGKRRRAEGTSGESGGGWLDAFKRWLRGRS